MGLKIADLLKYRTSIVLTKQNGESILDDKGIPIVVYLRIIGDDDLVASHRMARFASSAKRRALQDKDSLDWKEATQPIIEGSAEELRVYIKQAKTSNLTAEARSSVPRPDLPELEEFAADPDAASLFEKEQFEEAVDKVEADYQKALEEYIDIRTRVINEDLAAIEDIEKLREIALDNVSVLLCIGEYYAELYDQQTYRACYLDNTYRERAFDSVEEFKSADSFIKNQLIDKYLALEADPEQIKN
jgi:hypothetical protein